MFTRNATLFIVQLIVILAVLSTVQNSRRRKSKYRYDGRRTSPSRQHTKTMCMDMGSTLRARHKTCFLRADTGPCRADIIQWYFDAKQKKCYRFFWGGCQGNGNKFETKKECLEYCYMNSSSPPAATIPHFCSLAFDYGNCFGHYNRWGWDKFSKTCKTRLYSGCGGNQNNFESKAECLNTCLKAPNNTLQQFNQYTTCFPFDVEVK